MLDVDACAITGVWRRHVPAGADPIHRPQPPGDSRWQRGRVVDALYLADGDETLWAEWYRHLAERGLPPLRSLPRDVWSFHIESDRIADLSTPAQLERVGLPPPAPGRRTWRSYQRVGEQLHREGWAGLAAPSAARPAGRVLCLFAGGTLPAVAVPPPERQAEPPAPPAGMRT